MDDRLDLIIFGASGFTGKYAVKEAARLSKENCIKFGVAGRRKEALEAVVEEFAPEIKNIPIIIADLKDEESLKNMTRSAKVIVNCCGPFRFYGEPVIKACIATQTHHVDVSGEPEYMEKMQLEYNQAACNAGIYIISACGFDSIPCDLGIIFTQQNFEGDVNAIESYLYTHSTKNVNGSKIHYGTWESAIYSIAHKYELSSIRRRMYPTKLPIFWPKLQPRGIIHRSSVTDGWSVVFPGSDRSVALRTQRFLYEKYKQRPVQVQTYITFRSLFSVLLTAFFGLIFLVMTKYEWSRRILLKYPDFFSGGVISHDGPSPEAMDNTHFSIILKAQGWTEKLVEVTDKHKKAPNKELITKVSGVNPGYGATCTALLLSALTILKESDKMPNNGGVLPPGAAFSKTSLIEELNKNDIKFEILSAIEK